MPDELIRRDALERIIQRAAELQAGEQEIGEGLTKDDVLALGRDVGIPDRYLRQALLEERTRGGGAPTRTLLAWLVGAGELAAARVVPGERAAVERGVQRWMTEEELLQVRRRYPDVTTWEPRGGAFASIQRALGVRGRRYALAEAWEIRGQVEQLEPGFCHVRLAADVRNLRRRRWAGATVLATLGAVAGGALLGTGFPWALALLPALALGLAAVAVVRRHRRENGNVQLGLEQVLDRLERGEIKAGHSLPPPRPGTFVRLADEIRRALD